MRRSISLAAAGAAVVSAVALTCVACGGDSNPQAPDAAPEHMAHGSSVT